MFGPTRKRASSPQKRKPFVSTTKRNSSFGIPPPLPPLMISKENSATQCSVNNGNHDLNEGDRHLDYMTYFDKFQRMSVRWVNMSTCLWSMILGQHRSNINPQSLKNFIIVLYWRLNGSISEDEFHCLYMDWINSGAIYHKVNPGTKYLFLLRDILIEESTTEEDLEIFLGLIIFEANKGIINSTLSFKSLPTSVNLELCSARWLGLSEELFFLLDSSGFGYLVFDDLFFLSLCLLSSSGENGIDLDAQMSLTNALAVTIQLMQESGCDIDLGFPKNLKSSFDFRHYQTSPSLENHINQNILPHSQSTIYDENGRRILPSCPVEELKTLNKVPNQTSERNSHCSIGIMTLPNFKKLLLKRSVGETSLVTLISHIKHCLQQLITLSETKGIDILYSSCISATPDICYCTPKLWPACIKTIFDYSSPANTVPSIVLFTLTDALWCLPLSFLTSPSSLSTYQSNLFPDIKKDIFNHHLSTDVLLEYATACLCNSFTCWGSQNQRIEVDDALENNRRNSLSELIFSVIWEYKTAMELLCAAFIDLAMEYRDSSLCSASLQIAINSLLPQPHEYVSLLDWDLDNSIHQKELDQANPNSTISVTESEKPFDQTDYQQDISQAVWASVFDFRAHVNPVVGLVQHLPNRTINFVERRRKRRNHNSHSEASITVTNSHPISSVNEEVLVNNNSVTQLEEEYIRNEAGQFQDSSPQVSLSEDLAPLNIDFPSTVVELLGQQQSAGQYAQSLRDLLRKMSSNDSTLQLKVVSLYFLPDVYHSPLSALFS